MENAIDSHATGEAGTEPHRMIRVAETEVHRRKERTDHSQQKREKRKENRERRRRENDALFNLYVYVCIYLCMCAYVDVGYGAGLYDDGGVGGGMDDARVHRMAGLLRTSAAGRARRTAWSSWLSTRQT